MLIEAPVEGTSSSKADPYLTGRRLLSESGGPTMSAPGLAAKRDERLDERLEGERLDDNGDDDEELWAWYALELLVSMRT